MSENHVPQIASRLSLRPPQRISLENLEEVVNTIGLHKERNLQNDLEAISMKFKHVKDFERTFPSLCFALATGVGKTRLMGAFISYLHLAHGVRNFFVLAPNLTIYKKLIQDFTPGTKKYVFEGIGSFAIEPPELITGDNFDTASTIEGLYGVRINLFNISKINAEVRGGKMPKIRDFKENLGQGYFDYLASLPDLVLVMDESHRYRASAGVRAINDLKPVLGLELTATPVVETPKGPVRFKNVIYDYPLGQAMAEGFVKEPAVVARQNLLPQSIPPAQMEDMKLKDGIRMHEQVKVELETYAINSGQKLVKPFVLVITRDTVHAAEILKLIESDQFFNGRYKGKAIQVDSSQTGEKEDEMISRLLKVEDPNEPTEIVIHVNMLKEGWDVTNLYTIVPLRAANARILIEQSIGRGLRLPYGKRTGVEMVDTLNIIAHDKFNEIIDEARKNDSIIRLKTVTYDFEKMEDRKTIVSQPVIQGMINLGYQENTYKGDGADEEPTVYFTTKEELKVAELTLKAIQSLENKVKEIPGSSHLNQKAIQELLVEKVQSGLVGTQMTIGGVSTPEEVKILVKKATELYIQKTIDIPRITVSPKEAVKGHYQSFRLEMNLLRLPPIEEALVIEALRTNQRRVLTITTTSGQEKRLENYVVAGLIDYDDVSYQDNADVLYDLATQVIEHLRSYLASDKEVENVLQYNQRLIAENVHAQMQHHYVEEEVEYEVQISKGFSELKRGAFSADAKDNILDFRISPSDKAKIKSYVFSGFNHCLYEYQKFDSDTERKLAVMLDRTVEKWFKPLSGQFNIFYKHQGQEHSYLPDFVAETTDSILLLEPKKNDEMEDPEVLAKKKAARTWCQRASEHALSYGGKPWKYVLIPHHAVQDQVTLELLVKSYE